MSDYVKTINGEIKTRGGDLICTVENEFLLDEMLFAINSDVDFSELEEQMNLIVDHDIVAQELVKLIELDDIHQVLRADCEDLVKDMNEFISFAAVDDCEHMDQFITFKDRLERAAEEKEGEHSIEKITQRFEQVKKNLLRIENSIKRYYANLYLTAKGKYSTRWKEFCNSVPEISGKKEWLKELKAKKG